MEARLFPGNLKAPAPSSGSVTAETAALTAVSPQHDDSKRSSLGRTAKCTSGYNDCNFFRDQFFGQISPMIASCSRAFGVPVRDDPSEATGAWQPVQDFASSASFAPHRQQCILSCSLRSSSTGEATNWQTWLGLSPAPFPQTPPPACLPSSLCPECGRSPCRLRLLYRRPPA